MKTITNYQWVSFSGNIQFSDIVLDMTNNTISMTYRTKKIGGQRWSKAAIVSKAKMSMKVRSFFVTKVHDLVTVKDGASIRQMYDQKSVKLTKAERFCIEKDLPLPYVKNRHELLPREGNLVTLDWVIECYSNSEEASDFPFKLLLSDDPDNPIAVVLLVEEGHRYKFDEISNFNTGETSVRYEEAPDVEPENFTRLLRKKEFTFEVV